MSEPAARALLRSPATEGLCIRYVYDAERRVVFGGVPAAATVVPEHRLTSRLKARLALGLGATVAVAGAMLIEACGGAGLEGEDTTYDAGHGDGGVDGGDAGDGGK